jgi:hypothetical protein
MKTLITIFITVFTTIAVQAQTENREERLITQLKNGTVPGWRFAPNVPVAPAINKTVEAMRTKPNRAQTGILASEQPIQKEMQKAIAAPPPVPAQEAVKQENKQ